MLLLNPRRTRTNMKLLQLVWIFLLTLCGQSATTTMMVKEDDVVILDCSFGTNIEKKPFTWKKDVDKSNEEVFWYSGGTTDPGKEFRGRVSHFPDQLRFGNASIKIKKAKTSDSGNYTCYHATVQKEIKSNISLTVDPILKPRPEIEGATPEHYVTIFEDAHNSALLQCVVRGAFPKPEIVWTDGAGKILDADEPKVTEKGGNKYDIVLNVTVTKTDSYTCVATQKEINHQNNRTIFVRSNGGASKPYISIIEETEDGVLLQCEVFGASPELKVFWKNRAGQDVPSKEPQKTETGGGYDVILQTTVTKTDYYRCVTTEGKKNDEVYSENLVPVPEEKSSIVVPVVIAVLVAVLVTAVVVGVLAFVIVRRSKFNTGDSTTDGSIGKNESQAPLQQNITNNPED